MGIRGLKALLKRNAPECFSEITLDALKGKTVCIDSSILMYKFRYTYSDDNFHILGFLHKILELKDLKCIFVFDGKPPEAKRETLNKRKEKQNKIQQRLDQLKNLEFIDSDDESVIERLERNVKKVTRLHSLEVMELLKSIGIPFFVSESEAEKTCVSLQMNGHADYVLTEDTDSLTFGAKHVLFNKNGVFTVCSLDKVLQGLELTHPEFVDLCILCGCDYTGTIPKVGPVTALKLIRKHRFIENISNLPESFNYKCARELFKPEETSFQFQHFQKDITKFVEILSKWNIPEKYFIDQFHFCKINFNLI